MEEVCTSLFVLFALKVPIVKLLDAFWDKVDHGADPDYWIGNYSQDYGDDDYPELLAEVIRVDTVPEKVSYKDWPANNHGHWQYDWHSDYEQKEKPDSEQ